MKGMGATKEGTALEGSGLQAEMASVKPVQRRFLVPLAGVLLLLVVGFGLAMFKIQQKSMNHVSRQVLEDAADELSEALAEQSDALSTFEDILIHDAVLRDALKTRNRQRLLVEYQPLFTQLRGESGITHFYFHRSDRVNLLRLHKPDVHGDLIDRFTAREAERTGKTAAGIELGLLGTLTLRVVQPVFDGDMLLGYLELGKEFTDILERIRDEHGIELAATINKNHLEREKWESGMKMLGRPADWDRYADDVLIYSSLDPFPTEADRSVGDVGHTHHEITIETAFGAKPWRVLVSSLNDVSGAEVGDLIILQDISEARAAFHQLVAVSIGAALVLLSALFGFMFAILRRVDRSLCEQQADLARSEKFQRTLIKTSPDFIFVLDTDGTIWKVNRVLPGHREEGVVGQKAVMFIPPEYQYAFEETFRQAIDTRQLQTLETAMDLPDGRHYFLNRLNPLSLTDEECSVVLIATDITERKRAAHLQHALFRISESVNQTSNIEELLKTVHETLGTLIDTTNFYIALYDAKNDLYSFPYCVDLYEETDFTPQQLKKSLTEYVRRTEKPIIVNEQTHERLVNAGEVELIGRPSPTWLGVPLKTPTGIIGVAVLQSYSDPGAYSDADLNIMSFVSDHIAMAIERKRAEEALRESEKKHRELTENLPQRIFHKDTNLVYVSCNKHYAKDLGITPDEITGKTDFDFYPKEVAEKYRADDRRLMESGHTEEIEETYIQDGQELTVQTVKTPQIDGANNVTGILGIFWDISERKQAETALLSERHKLNERVKELNGLYSLSKCVEIPNVTLPEIFQSLSELLPSCWQYPEITCGRVIFNDNEFKTDNFKETQWLQSADIKVFGEKQGTIDVYYLRECSVLDEGPFLKEERNLINSLAERLSRVIERKQAEKAKVTLQAQLLQSEKLASVGQLSAGVAHEINNPIGFISSNLGTMKKYLTRVRSYLEGNSGQDPDKQREITEIVTDFDDAISESLEGADRVKKIVAALKGFARADTGKLEAADLNAELESTLNIVWNQIKYTCKVEKDFGELPAVSCHKGQINQVMLNLLVNAGQAIGDGPGTIRIRTWADDTLCYISVKDDGCGIAQEHIDKIFDPFFTTKDVGKGTGLGLSVSHEIVKNHGGRMEVQSEVGQGSEFVVSLPIEPTLVTTGEAPVTNEECTV